MNSVKLDHLYTSFLNSNGVCTDSRQLKPGQIFFALRGPNFDGNTYARQAIDAIAVFTRHRTIEDFQQDLMLRSAVERQLEIVGEALSQLARHDPDMANRIADLRQIIGFRNILVHGYSIVDPDQVWRIIHESLPELRETVDRILEESPPDSSA